MSDASVIIASEGKEPTKFELELSHKRAEVQSQRKTRNRQHLISGLFVISTSTMAISSIWSHSPVKAVAFLLILGAQIYYWRKLTKIASKRIHAAEEDLVVLIGQRQDLETSEATKRLEASIPEIK